MNSQFLYGEKKREKDKSHIIGFEFSNNDVIIGSRTSKTNMKSKMENYQGCQQ